MKDFAANILFAVAVIVAVVFWYGFSNNFSGVITAKEEYIPKAEMVVATPPPPPPQGENAGSLPPPPPPQALQGGAASLPPPPPPPPAAAVSRTLSAQESFLRSAFCKSQHEDLLKKKSHSEIVDARINNPKKYDLKCFSFSELGDPSIVEKCLIGTKNKVVFSEIDKTMCMAITKIYQAYVTDFLFPDDVDVKSLPQQVLQRKIQAHLLKVKNPQLLLLMVQTLITSYPNDFEALKIYIKAVGFGQKPIVYAEGGKLFPYIQKAYQLNPNDLEMREIYMYAIIHSENGYAKIQTAFPNVKEDPKLQALRYYYLAWAAWNKGDRTQALNNLEFAKSLSKNEAKFREAYDKVKDETNLLKSEGVFYLSFSVI